MSIETVVVKREDTIDRTVMASTPADMPNVLVKALSPVRIVATRVIRVYLQSLLGMLTVVMSGVASDALITPTDFQGKLALAAGFALAPSAITLLQNAAELLAKWDETNASWRA